MTFRVKLELIAASVVLIGLVIGARVWLSEHDARVHAEAIQAAQKTVIDQATADRASHQKQDDARDAQTASTIQAMQAIVDKLKTPQQQAAWIPQQIPVPQPFTITVPQSTTANPKPDAIATIPQVDLPAIRDAISGCQQCGLKLSTAQADLASRDQQMKDAVQQIKAITAERDTWKQTAKGGSVLHRVGQAAKYLIIGAAVGYVAARH